MSRPSHRPRIAEIPESKGPAAYVVEFVGTFFLVLGICGVVSAGAPDGAVLTDVALVHTLVLMAMVYAIGSISGCHVKTHLKAIYRKLDVGDRRTAVRRARELELLGPA